MNLDVIDLYYQHFQDPDVEPEAVAKTMSELIREGKIRYWGISNASADYIRRADDVCKVSAVQDHFSIIQRENEQKLFPLLEKRNIGFVAYSPLANGFLTNAKKTQSEYEAGLDYRSMMPQYSEEGKNWLYIPSEYLLVQRWIQIRLLHIYRI